LAAATSSEGLRSALDRAVGVGEGSQDRWFRQRGRKRAVEEGPDEDEQELIVGWVVHRSEVGAVEVEWYEGGACAAAHLTITPAVLPLRPSTLLN
jgi:hypothetical protein